MKKDDFIRGLFLGGILGISVALLTANATSAKEKKESNSFTEIKNKIKNQIEDNKASENNQDNEGTEGTENLDMNDSINTNQTGAENSKILFNDTADEDTEKDNQAAEELRNPKGEVEMKAKKEGEALVEDFASKLNFGKKIAQLEEALRSLREENTN